MRFRGRARKSGSRKRGGSRKRPQRGKTRAMKGNPFKVKRGSELKRSALNAERKLAFAEERGASETVMALRNFIRIGLVLLSGVREEREIIERVERAMQRCPEISAIDIVLRAHAQGGFTYQELFDLLLFKATEKKNATSG